MVTISVLMPVFNAQKYLSAAIESILTQTFGDFELIVLDDGSTDATLRILQEFQKRGPRIRIISRENRGLIKSANELLGHAQGEFVARMDADDIALPARFSLQVAFLREHPEVVCVGGATEMIDGEGRYLTQLQLPETDQDIQRLALAGHGSITHSCAMIRRESLVSIGGYDPEAYAAEDLDLWLKLGEIGQLANLHEPVLSCRLHSGSISERNPSHQRAAARKACERAWQRRGIQGTFEASDPWRPGPDPDSRLKFMLRYGWWAFNSRERQTAIIYGLRAIRAMPFKPDGWKLFACALLKPFETQR